MNEHAHLCQIGTAGKGMPCLANINTLAGLLEPCEVCAETLPKMRELMGWVPFHGFYMSNKLADFQHDALLDRIAAARGIKARQAGAVLGTSGPPRSATAQGYSDTNSPTPRS